MHVGSAGLKAHDIVDGYVGTLCFVVDEPKFDGESDPFHDIHVTYEQLKQIREHISRYIALIDAVGPPPSVPGAERPS